MLPSLSCSPLPSQLRPGRPFFIAAARNFARFCRSNLQRSCALRFDSARAFLSLSGAVDYISSLHLTFQSAHFLMACVCFVSNPGIYRSRAPPQLYFPYASPMLRLCFSYAFPMLFLCFPYAFPLLSLCILILFPYFCYCLLYTSPSPRDRTRSRMPSSA